MRIERVFAAEMAHKVPGAYTCRCHHLHGHSYRFAVAVEAPAPDKAHMVMDFKLLEGCGIKDFFDGFDHAVVLDKDDELAPMIDRINPDRHLLVPFLPTAEMIAKASFVICAAILDRFDFGRGETARLLWVTVHETARGSATYSREDLADDRFPAVDLSAWVISEQVRCQWEQHPALASQLPPHPASG